MSDRVVWRIFQAGLILPALLLAFAASVYGQGSTGAINGTVTDPSGSVVPGVSVVLKNTATAAEQVATTNADGRYVFPTVQPGYYTLTLTKQGFTTINEPRFQTAVNQTATHDFTLQVGATTQELTVEATATAIEASTAELGTAIQTQEVNNLPLNGRNFTQLLTLTPGTSPISTGQNSGGGGGFAGAAIGSFTFPSVNGQTNRSNMFLLDGFTDYAFVGNYAVSPIIDAVDEFKVQSHNDITSYGGSMGGIINIVSKGGTSQYHGSLWEFLRNSSLDARNTFSPAVTVYRQNQFGATAGGPVFLSRLRGHRPPKTFFFVGYEGFRAIRGAQQLDTVPTPAEYAGDFSGISAQLYNPFSTTPDPNHPGQYLRAPFVNNQIPVSLLNAPTIAYMQKFYPQPVNTGIPNVNYIDTTPNTTNSDTGTMRIDHQISDRLSSWFRLTKFAQEITSVNGNTPGVLNGNNVDGYQTGGSATWTSGSGNKVLSARFGRTSAFAVVANQFPGDLGNAYQVGEFNTLYTTGFLGGRSFNPGFGIPGYTGIPEGNYQGNAIADIWEGAADFSWVKGKHTLQMGGDINTNGGNQPILFVNQSYSSFQTADLESTSSTGNALASALLGLPTSVNRRNVNITTHGGWVDGFYFQDQWKVSDKLQLNLGLRYDLTLWPIYGSPQDNNQYVGDTDLDTGNYILARVPPACSTGVSPCIPTPGGLLPPHVTVTNSGNGSIIHNTFDNWQPRMGLAYRVAPNTVIRASVGRFFDNWAAIQQLATNYQGNWPDTTFLLANNLNSNIPNATAQNPLGLGNGSQILPAPTPFNQVNWMIDPYYKNAYSIQWNFGLQQQIGKNATIEANYVGSQDSRLDSGAYRNTAVVPGPGPISDRQPFPYITPTYFDKSVGKASYESFQFKGRESTSNGLTLLVSYTWSKTINLGCDGFFGSEGCSIQNAYNLNADRSVAGYDIPQNLSVSWVYELPVGHGKRVDFSNGFVNAALGGWTLNGIFTARSGQPFTVNASGDIANTGNVVERADLNCTDPYAPHPNRNAYLNTACFSTPAPFTFGTAGRNDVRSPHVTNLDLSLFKIFPIHEDTRLEFRSEFFNALNQSSLGVPDSTVTDPKFGQITSTAQTEREIQFALKLYF
ncbi:MAG TPA: TonB-dependent receptor [Bryobacteraceae bacterium]|jgi:hypothetical protein|nr:TonB-dependent receptor [Bryobacteraceae bacterium]